MMNRPPTVAAVRALIRINAVIWLAFGLIIAADLHPALPDSSGLKWTMSAMALATAVLLLAFLTLLRNRGKVAYFIYLALFSGVSILTITDEFGLADLVVLTLNIVPILLLIKDRAWYLERNILHENTHNG